MQDKWLSEILADLIVAGNDPVTAAKRLMEQFSESEVKQALLKYEQQIRKIREISEIPAIYDESGLWYAGPRPTDLFWPPYKEHLLQVKEWSEEAVGIIDAATTKIVSHMRPPYAEEVDTRGLVLGHVQSGKTANFLGLIAKTADVNYRLFIVLSGLTNVLRSQTQARLETDLLDQQKQRWISLTTVADDFYPGPRRNVEALLTGTSKNRVIFVVKKNKDVLERVLDWLSRASDTVLSSCPALIIDDEADQASINTSDPDLDRSMINSLVVAMIERLPRVAYVGYTATPFANVLINPGEAHGLYPRDFIIDLPKPRGHFGTEDIFGRPSTRLFEDDQGEEGLDVIRTVPDEDAALLRPPSMKDRFSFEPEVTQSLRSALHYFWSATAARWARGQSDRHSTMLIHTTRYIDTHDKLGDAVRRYHATVKGLVSTSNASGLRSIFAHQWKVECDRVPAIRMGEQKVEFDDLLKYLPKVLDQSQVIIEHSGSDKRIEFQDEPKVQIVIGGDVLSRGLTLEGLVVSYFVRSASAYDTLLQMGRWFGFRSGYSDLPRIWMTRELNKWFYDIAAVESEIRTDIQKYEIGGLTPTEFSVRIPTHPILSVTARAKMQSAIRANMSFSGRRVQTVLFKREDRDWLESNIDSTKSLLAGFSLGGIHGETLRGSSFMFRHAPADLVQRFVSSYHFYGEYEYLDPANINQYIDSQRSLGQLDYWNVVVKGRLAREDQRYIEMIPGRKFTLLTRSRRIDAGEVNGIAKIGALMSRGDRVIDLDIPATELEGKNDGELQSLRPPGIGLLLLYPIDKYSEPDSDSSVRKPLDAATDVIGVALVFPEAGELTSLEYVTADLSAIQDQVPED